MAGRTRVCLSAIKPCALLGRLLFKYRHTFSFPTHIALDEDGVAARWLPVLPDRGGRIASLACKTTTMNKMGRHFLLRSARRLRFFPRFPDSMRRQVEAARGGHPDSPHARRPGARRQSLEGGLWPDLHADSVQHPRGEWNSM